jgi:ribosomal protein L37E
MCLSAGNAGAPCWEPYRREPACPARGGFDDGGVHLLWNTAASPRGTEIGSIPGLNGCRLGGSIEEGPTAEAAARRPVRSRLVATEPQWPRMNRRFHVICERVTRVSFRKSACGRCGSGVSGHRHYPASPLVTMATSRRASRPPGGRACHATRTIAVCRRLCHCA